MGGDGIDFETLVIACVRRHPRVMKINLFAPLLVEMEVEVVVLLFRPNRHRTALLQRQHSPALVRPKAQTLLWPGIFS